MGGEPGSVAGPRGDAVQWRSPATPGRDLTFYDELRAIEALIAAHPDEWAELLDGLGGMTRLDEKRRQRRQRSG